MQLRTAFGGHVVKPKTNLPRVGGAVDRVLPAKYLSNCQSGAKFTCARLFIFMFFKNHSVNSL